jgi:hypothetical protein
MNLSRDGGETWKVDIAQQSKGYPAKSIEMVATKKELWRLRKERGSKVLE